MKANKAGESLAKWLVFLLLDPAGSGLIPTIPELFFRGKKSVSQWRWLQKSGHQLENVNQSHQVLGSGKNTIFHFDIPWPAVEQPVFLKKEVQLNCWEQEKVKSTFYFVDS